VFAGPNETMVLPANMEFIYRVDFLLWDLQEKIPMLAVKLDTTQSQGSTFFPLPLSRTKPSKHFLSYLRYVGKVLLSESAYCEMLLEKKQNKEDKTWFQITNTKFID
jgi:hypothetical protein